MSTGAQSHRAHVWSSGKGARALPSPGPVALSEDPNGEGAGWLCSRPWPPHPGLRLRYLPRGKLREGSGSGEVTASQLALATCVGLAKLGWRLGPLGEPASGPGTRLTCGPQAGTSVSLPTSLFLRSPLSLALPEISASVPATCLIPRLSGPPFLPQVGPLVPGKLTQNQRGRVPGIQVP